MSTIYVLGFPGPSGGLDLPDWRLFPLSETDPVSAFTTRVRGQQYLLRVTFPGSSAQYVAANFGRSTTPGDTPSGQYVPGKFEGSPNYGITLFSGIEPNNSSGGGVGEITLLDPEGDFDALVNEPWDGATVEILRGNVADDFSTYTLVATVTASGILYNQRTKRIQLRDLGWVLEQAQLHDQVYGGTGGVEGDPALEGQDKPYCVGRVFQVAPILINGALLIYQVSCSSIRSVIDLRDGGVSLSPGADFADYASLAAAVLSGGTYATCKALGLVRLGSQIVYVLTGDFEGDNDTISGQTYPFTRGQIARRIAIGRGTLKLTDSQIDLGELNTLEADQPAVCGWYWSTQPTKAAALREVMSGCLGYFAMRLNGTLLLGSLKAPTDDTSALIAIYSEDFSSEPKMEQGYQAPRQATYIGYSRNYTVMSPNQVAGSVDATTGAIYQQDTRWGVNTNLILPATWPTAPIIRIAGGFSDYLAAAAEAVRQQSMMQTRRERWQLTLQSDPFVDMLGKVIEIQNFTRFGWGGLKKLRVVGMSFAPSSLGVTYDLWG